MDDQGSLRRVGQDPDALALFYVQHVESVMRFLARRFADPQEIADLTGDVFLAVIESAHTWRPERGEPRAWLFGIARHVVASRRRRLSRQADREAVVAGWRFLDTDDVDRMIDRVDSERRARVVYDRIQALPAAERAVAELVAVDGLTPAEAAAVLEIRPATARVRLLRARRAVTSGYDDSGGELPAPASIRPEVSP